MLFNIELKPKTEKEKVKDEQEEALDKLKQFVNNDDIAISLVGSAGSGKTTLTGKFINWLDSKNIDYTVAAPTHKAKLVIQSISKHEAKTLHQLLALSPNIEILELDYRDLLFEIKKSDKPVGIPYKGIVIVDEASMIHDDLFDLLIDKIKERHSKVIFVGDEKQLKPVKAEDLSKVFTLPNKITLTKIYRQKENSPVLDILSKLRDHPLYSFSNSIGKEDSLFVYNNSKEFFKDITPILKETVESGDILNSKILAYTNARVNSYNEVVRKIIFGDDSLNEFNEKEILTGKDNFDFDGFKFWNSMDYIIKNKPVLSIENIPYCPFQVKGYHLMLYDSVYKEDFPLFMLSRDNSNTTLNFISILIEQTRLDAINSFGKKRREAWQKYYRIINSFATSFDLFYNNRVIKKRTFNYGYASTVHCSQGSSYNSIIIDMGNIFKVKTELELRQLQYVALSRTRGNAYIFI